MSYVRVPAGYPALGMLTPEDAERGTDPRYEDFRPNDPPVLYIDAPASYGGNPGEGDPIVVGDPRLPVTPPPAPDTGTSWLTPPDLPTDLPHTTPAGFVALDPSAWDHGEELFTPLPLPAGGKTEPMPPRIWIDGGTQGEGDPTVVGDPRLPVTPPPVPVDDDSAGDSSSSSGSSGSGTTRWLTPRDRANDTRPYDVSYGTAPIFASPDAPTVADVAQQQQQQEDAGLSTKTIALLAGGAALLLFLGRD